MSIVWLYSAQELHTNLKTMAIALTDQLVERDTMLWRAKYSQHYRSYMRAYHAIFNSPTTLELYLYRQSIGETIMTIL